MSQKNEPKARKCQECGRDICCTAKEIKEHAKECAEASKTSERH